MNEDPNERIPLQETDLVEKALLYLLLTILSGIGFDLFFKAGGFEGLFSKILVIP